MRRHPVEMIDAFIKAASALRMPARPAGVVGVAKAQTSFAPKRPAYAQPNPPGGQTAPGLVASQKATPPPPVM